MTISLEAAVILGTVVKEFIDVWFENNKFYGWELGHRYEYLGIYFRTRDLGNNQVRVLVYTTRRPTNDPLYGIKMHNLDIVPSGYTMDYTQECCDLIFRSGLNGILDTERLRVVAGEKILTAQELFYAENPPPLMVETLQPGVL